MWRMTGYSSVTPFAPSTWRAVRATSSAALTLPSLPMLTCSGRRRPSSFSRPRWSASSVARLTSSAIVRELAAAGAGTRAIGLPNCDRAPCCTRARPRSTRAPRRPRRRRCRSAPRSGTTAGPQRRSPRAASRSAGRRTSSSSSSEVTDARSDSFLWMSCVVKPLRARAGRGSRGRPRRSRAQTTATSAIEPFVIHIFWPCRIQSSPSRRARVRIEPGSEPASGSVRPKQPIASPAAMRGQPLLLLLLRAPAVDRVHRQRALHGDEAAHAAVAGLELQAGEAVGGRARAGAAVALEVHAEHAELAELASRARAGCAPPRTSRRRSGRTRSRTKARTVSRMSRSSSERRRVDGEEVLRAQVGRRRRGRWT